MSMPEAHFAGRVAEVLGAAGWYPGRDIGAEADELIARTVAAAQSEGYPLEPFPALVAAVHEFGGLTVTKKGTGVEFPGNDFGIDPSAVARRFDVYADLETYTRTPVFPLGPELDESTTLAMDATGRVYLLHYTGYYVVGDDVHTALAAFIERTDVLPDILDFFDPPEVLTAESGGRFNEEVTRALMAAGWAPGRDLGPAADAMVSHTLEAARAAGHALEAVPAAVAVLHEFGGLTVTKAGTGVDFAGDDFRIDPTGADAWFGHVADLERRTGRRCFPLGPDLEFDFVLAVDADGRIYRLAADGEAALVGDTPDRALAAWIQESGEFAPVGGANAEAEG
jgi:hypothetical protein